MGFELPEDRKCPLLILYLQYSAWEHVKTACNPIHSLALGHLLRSLHRSRLLGNPSDSPLEFCYSAFGAHHHHMAAILTQGYQLHGVRTHNMNRKAHTIGTQNLVRNTVMGIGAKLCLLDQLHPSPPISVSGGQESWIEPGRSSPGSPLTSWLEMRSDPTTPPLGPLQALATSPEIRSAATWCRVLMAVWWLGMDHRRQRTCC